MLNIFTNHIEHVIKEGESLLWSCSVTTKRTYRPLKWEVYEDRIKESYSSQDFQNVKYLLVRTGEERFYPLPLLLNIKVAIPHYAEDIAEKIFDLILE